MGKGNGKDVGKASQGKIIQIDEEQIKVHLDEMVCGNGRRDAECSPGC